MKAKRGRGPRGGHGGSGSDLQKDLQLIQSDPRFAHVASDPKYRHIPKKERKVKLDSRFHSILTDEKFYEKSTMDPRGRKGNYSTKEDLLRFYHMSSDEDSEEEEEDGDDEEEEEEEEEEEDDDEDKEDEKEREEDDDEEEEEKEEKIESSREEGNENLYISIDRKGKRDKGLKKERKPEEESEKGKKEVKEKTKKKKGKKSITEQETTEREEDDGDEDNKEQEEDDTSKRDEEERSQVTPEVRSRLKDLTRDYARGGGDLFSSDSSDDDSTTTDEEEEEAEEFEWAELDQDAVWDNEAEVEETSRIAICNLDWDRIKAADLMVLFSSFCPRGGFVRSVAIYPSEYGKQRMAEEDRSGPQELTGRGKKWKGKEEVEDEDEEEEEEEEENKRTMDLVDLDKLEKGKLDESVGATKRDFEALRRYQRNRLRYFYAVMECDTVDTARALYKECDRQPFEGAGILLDMRYIPSDMVFDETPHDLCRTVPQTYRAKSFVTTALQSTRPALTWDETDPDRAKTLGTAMAQALKGGSLDDDQLRDFIATSSEEEDEDERRAEEEEDDNSSDEDGNEDVKAARIAKFRALIQEIDAKERRRKEREIDMEDTLEEKEVEEEEEEEGEQEEEEEKKSTKDTQLNPFEKYLEKRRAKKKEKRQKQKGKKMKGGTEENSDTDDDAISDDDLPEGMDDLYSDPFFAEELENRKKEKKRIKKKKHEDGEKEEDDSTDKGNLELLLMEEEEEDKRHFNMREIIKSSEQDTRKKKRKKNLKKKMKEKQEEHKKKVDDFKVNVSDPRFSELMTSGEYNIDPSHPHFKRTKAMDGLIGEIQRKRRVESGEELPGAKRPHLEEETKTNLELTSLVQRVKRKTGKGKKPAKRNDHDTT